MANISFPDGSITPFFNPAAHEGAAAEARKSAGGKGKKVESKKGFASFLQKAVLENIKELPFSEESLHELLDEVHNAGDALSRRPFPPEIAAYREAVGNFIHYVVVHSYDTEEQNKHARFKQNRKPFILIKVIDSKLEGMAAAILRGQIDQLTILEKVDEIKGLLVDMVLGKPDTTIGGRHG